MAAVRLFLYKVPLMRHYMAARYGHVGMMKNTLLTAATIVRRSTNSEFSGPCTEIVPRLLSATPSLGCSTV